MEVLKEYLILLRIQKTPVLIGLMLPGEKQARLEPIEVTGATAKDRDLNSFYFHDSEKGYSHGCTEVESALFTKLREYREEGNQSIEVMVDYPNRNHRTNGGTKKEKKSELKSALIVIFYVHI